MTMTVKEWAEEYRRINEWEQAERVERLPRETVRDSVRSYFALCQMLMPFVVDAYRSPELSEHRQGEYLAVLERWRRLARTLSHAAES